MEGDNGALKQTEKSNRNLFCFSKMERKEVAAVATS
jgi:hypothetical protein